MNQSISTGRVAGTGLAPVPGGRKTRRASPYREDSRSLGSELLSLREERRLTREEVAARSDVSVSTLQKIETGPVVEPGYFTVVALCRALDVDLRHLDEAYRTLRDSSDST